MGEWIVEVKHRGKRFHVIGGGGPLLDMIELTPDGVREPSDEDRRSVLEKFHQMRREEEL